MTRIKVDEIIDAKVKVPPKPKGIGHGGVRPNSGRKTADYERPVERVDYEAARARHEAAKADNAELEFKIKSGQWVERAVVRQVQATAYATISQTLRSVPDNLERRGVPVDICERVGLYLDDALNDLADAFEMLAGEEEGSTNEH